MKKIIFIVFLFCGIAYGEESNLIISTTDYYLHFPEPSHTFLFYDDSNEVGRFDFEGGTFTFRGNLDKSAKAFFEWVKPYMDDYMRKYKCDGDKR